MVASVQACATESCFNSVAAPSEDFIRYFPNVQILCDDCDLKRIEKLQQEQAAEEQERRQEAFNAICPPLLPRKRPRTHSSGLPARMRGMAV